MSPASVDPSMPELEQVNQDIEQKEAINRFKRTGSRRNKSEHRGSKNGEDTGVPATSRLPYNRRMNYFKYPVTNLGIQDFDQDIMWYGAYLKHFKRALQEAFGNCKVSKVIKVSLRSA